MCYVKQESIVSLKSVLRIAAPHLDLDKTRDKAFGPCVQVSR